MWDSKKRKHICENCGAEMIVTASYPDHQNLYCPKCHYRDIFPKPIICTQCEGSFKLTIDDVIRKNNKK